MTTLRFSTLDNYLDTLSHLAFCWQVGDAMQLDCNVSRIKRSASYQSART